MHRSTEFRLQSLLAVAPRPAAEPGYPTRTPFCPSLARFRQGVGSGWGRDERAHVTGCPYCQHRTAKQWLFTPPGPVDLACYLAGLSPDSEAMGIYLSWPEGEALRLLQFSAFVRALAEVFRVSTHAAQGLRGIAADFPILLPALPAGAVRTRGGAVRGMPAEGLRTRGDAVGGKPVDVAARADRAAAGWILLAETLPEGPLRVVAADGSVSAELERLPLGMLRIRASAAGGENAGRRVFVEALPRQGEPARFALELRQTPGGDAAEADLSAPLADAETLLHGAALLIAWAS